MPLQVHKVTSLDSPELEPYRTLRRPVDHIRRGIFVAEGEKVVRRLLDSELAVLSLLLTPEWYERIFGEKSPAGSEIHSRVKNASIYTAEKRLLESIVGFNLHQGIMAVGKVPEPGPIDGIMTGIPSPHLLVAIDGLVSAENVGVVVRNCAAFGVDAIIAGETSSSPYLRRAVRNSMGTVFHLPVVHADNLADSLKMLSRRWSTTIVGAVPGGDATLEGIPAGKNLCIVFGNEEAGISAGVLGACDVRVAIPMSNRVDSLNVASASAVFLHRAAIGRRNGLG